MTDPIADMLTRIRNAQAVHKDTVLVPYSNVKRDIARVLKEEGYIQDVMETEEGSFRVLRVALKYHHDATPAIRVITRISKPGCRIYTRATEIPTVLNNYGIAIVSTSRGVMSNHAARKAKVGGEVLCEIS